jgi:hypothetical protein
MVNKQHQRRTRKQGDLCEMLHRQDNLAEMGKRSRDGKMGNGDMDIAVVGSNVT